MQLVECNYGSEGQHSAFKAHKESALISPALQDVQPTGAIKKLLKDF